MNATPKPPRGTASSPTGLPSAVTGAVISSAVILVVAVILLITVVRQRTALEGRMDELKGDIATISTRQEQTSDRDSATDEIRGMLVDLKKNDQHIAADNVATAKRIGDLETATGQVAQSMMDLKVAVEGFRNRIEQMENQLSSISQQDNSGEEPQIPPIIKRIEMNQEKLLSTLDSIQSELRELEQGQVNQEDRIAQLQGKVLSLEDRLRKWQEDMLRERVLPKDPVDPITGNPVKQPKPTPQDPLPEEPVDDSPVVPAGEAKLEHDLKPRFELIGEQLVVTVEGLVFNRGEGTAIGRRAEIYLQIVQGTLEGSTSPFQTFPGKTAGQNLEEVPPGGATSVSVSFAVDGVPDDPDMEWKATWDIRFK